MEKPQSLSHKEFLIRKISVDLFIPEKTVEEVISHQFDSLAKAMGEGKRSVELSGFGKFLFLEHKGKRHLEKCLSQIELFDKMSKDESLSQTRRRNAALKKETAENNLKYISLFYEQASADNRRVEESPDTSSFPGGTDKHCE